MKTITAKVRCLGINSPAGQEFTTVQFQPDYTDDKNKEWAWATPSLNLTMTVRREVAEQWGVQAGKTYTLTFEEN